jgi:hypothetical protein
MGVGSIGMRRLRIAKIRVKVRIVIMWYGYGDARGMAILPTTPYDALIASVEAKFGHTVKTHLGRLGSSLRMKMGNRCLFGMRVITSWRCDRDC